MRYYVYMLRCADGTLYTGISTDVERRAAVHNSGKGAKYTRSRLPVAVLYREECADQSAALRRERAIKKLTRSEKLKLARTIDDKQEEAALNLVILDGYTENPGDLSWEGLEALGNLTVYDRTPLNNDDQIIARIGQAEMVFTNKTPLRARVFAECPAIRYVGVLATGYNIVDVAAARTHGIPVCNIPTYGTDAVGQFAIALLLEICHHVGHHHEAVQAGRWQQSPDWCFWDYPLIELAHKTMGVIGFGRIGQTTGRIAGALGMELLAYDAYPNESGRAIADYVSLDELFARSDVISLHCPLFPETEGLIRKENIAKMKDGVILLNNSRGQLIVEQDLADALNSGKVYAAGLDVVSSEPIRGDNPLLGAKNCIITPHISWAPKESRMRLMRVAVENARAFLAGSPVNVVNP